MICRMILRVVGFFVVMQLEDANFLRGEYNAQTKEAI